MSEIYLLSTLLMGVLLVATALAVSRSGQRATPTGDSGGRSGYVEWSDRTDAYSSRVERLAHSPTMWTIGFVLLAVVFLAGVVVVIEGVPSGAGFDGAILENALLGVGGAVLVGFVFFGAYFSARDRFGQTAAGVAIAAAVVGALLLLGIVVAIVTG